MSEHEEHKSLGKLSRFGRNPEPGYGVRANVWIEKNGELYIGGGRIILLERIAEMGSISAAARSMGLGYRNAWLWIKAMNQLAPNPLVIKTRGGHKGGHAQVTEEGKKAIAAYKVIRSKLDNLLDSDQFQVM